MSYKTTVNSNKITVSLEKAAHEVSLSRTGGQGSQGLTGESGESAYAIAVEAGFVGTIEEWLESLVGSQGDAGADSTVPGPQGPQGPAGASNWVDITGTPTTIAGYGITDASTTAEMNSAISTAVGNLINAAPAALDTLDELAAAMGDDSNFATTMTDALSGKVDDSQVLTNVPAGAVFTDTTYTNVSEFTNDSGFITGYTVTQGDVTGHQAALSITESQISDLGTYETADATILKDADIGVNVEAYDATILKDADIGVTVQAAGSYETADATILKDADIGVTVQAYDATYLVDADIGVTVQAPATTIAGYGITDAYTETEVDSAISTAIGNLVDTAPLALDTLNELAASLNDDADFASTMTTALAGKEPADATILKDADIGVNVQAYDANIVSDATYVATANDFTTVLKDKLDGIAAGATADQLALVETCKNVSGGSLSAGTPVYQSGTAGNAMEVQAARADTAGSMPAVGILAQTLADDAEGTLVLTGFVQGLNTSTYSEGDTLYIAATGGLTTTPPAGEANLIQNIGKVIKVHASNGSIMVTGAGRANATPNLDDGDIFIGNGSNQSSTVSFNDTVDAHLNQSTANTGEVLSWDGSDYDWVSVGGPSYVVKTTAYTAVAGNNIIADTSGGAFTITLPATPSAGDVVKVADGASWSTNNLTVARNGSTIEGDAEDMVMDLAGVNAQFVYDGSTWQVYAHAGITSDLKAYTTTEFTATASQTTFTVDYTVGSVDVYLNGIRLADADYTATNGTTIVLGVAADLNDVLEVVAWSSFTLADVASSAQGALADTALQTVAFSDLTTTPTTVAGYGITDAYSGSFADLTSKPTTIAGYGITDAFDGAYGSLSGTPTLGTAAATASTDYATAAQGALADSAVQPNDDPTFGTVNATTVDLGNWTITESGGSLYFATGGTNKMKLDASGNLDVVGSVNSSATIT